LPSAAVATVEAAAASTAEGDSRVDTDLAAVAHTTEVVAHTVGAADITVAHTVAVMDTGATTVAADTGAGTVSYSVSATDTPIIGHLTDIRMLIIHTHIPTTHTAMVRRCTTEILATATILTGNILNIRRLKPGL